MEANIDDLDIIFLVIFGNDNYSIKIIVIT